MDIFGTNNIITWHTEFRAVADLYPWKDNPRKIHKKELDTLKERITKRGFHAVLVIDTENTILSGNQRKEALMQLGIPEVDVLVPSRPLTEDEKKKIALESNIHDGEWDFEKIQAFDLDLLQDIRFPVVDLQILDKTLHVKEEDFDVQEAIANIKEPKTKLGDTIFLGDHKIVCGDSTDPSVLEKLLGDERVSMIYSDPVYNINYNYTNGFGGKSDYGGTVNDTRSYDEYRTFLYKSMQNALAVSRHNVHMFYWSDQVYIGLIQ